MSRSAIGIRTVLASPTTWLCIVLLTGALACLIVARSVMGGFASEVRDRIKGTLADMSISKGQSGFPGYEDILTVVRATEGVAAASPVLEGLALVRLPDNDLGRDFTRWCYFWGVDPEAEAKVSRFAEWCAGGASGDAAHFRIDGRPVEHAIVLGQELDTARIREAGGDIRTKLLRDTGDTVVLSTVAFHAASSGVTSYLPFTMAGTWRSGMSEMDSQMAFVPLESAQLLRKMPGRITKINVRLEDYESHDAVRLRLHEALFPFGRFVITTWEEERSNLLSAVALERKMVTGWGLRELLIVTFLAMTIHNMTLGARLLRPRAVGDDLRSRGGPGWTLFWSSLMIGAVVCLVGGLAGMIVAENLAALEAGRFLDRSVYYFEEIPTVTDWPALAGFAAGVMVVCALSSLLPTWWIRRLSRWLTQRAEPYPVAQQIPPDERAGQVPGSGQVLGDDIT